MSRSWKVRVGDGEVSVLHESATSGPSLATFVCAHGAGGNMQDRGMQAVAKELRGRGVDVVRFNFPYSERKSGRPDPMPVLRACIEAVMAEVEHEGPLLIGGRSMGGRAASMMAADHVQADGLLLLAYPLHPAGKPDQLRDAHLPSITIPTLCLNGTRDALCRRDLMDAVLPRLGKNFQMHWLEGADHSFHVLKSSGRTDAEVMEEIGAATASWLAKMLCR
ncbi:MAG TPA: alpha/beta family hydrolase [Gemmatimonadaceae bacterium]|nr:alpha/beta family hydrolase [Gemmatimonadaceae bacterium]